MAHQNANVNAKIERKLGYGTPFTLLKRSDLAYNTVYKIKC